MRPASPGRSCSATIWSSSSSIWRATMTSRSRSAARRGNPLPLCARRTAGSRSASIGTAELSRWFPTTELAHIGDEIADGVWDQRRRRAAAAGAVRRPAHRFHPGAAAPLHRHPGRARPAATSCSPTTIRYVDEFVRWALRAAAATDSRYTALSARGRHVYVTPATADPEARDRRQRLAPAPDAGLSPDGRRTAPASRWSTSASARPTPRRSATTSRCCGPRPG